MSTATLPFNMMTNRILEQSGYSDIDLIKVADRKEISTAIKKAGFDASKSRVCIQEINDYFSNQEKKIEEDTAKIRSVQYLSPTASESTARRKKIIDDLLGSSSYIVLNAQEYDKLLHDFSETEAPITINVVRDSIKAMGYYYTTAIGTRQKGCYISKTKDPRDIVRHRVGKVLKSMSKKPYDQVEKIRMDYLNRLKSKEYVILDSIQFEDILLKISPYENQPLDTTTFRKLISDNNCCFVTVDHQRYYYVSAKHLYSRKDASMLKQTLNEELKKNPRVFDNFRDDIAKLLIHADIVYIKDFDGVEDEFLREFFKEVNYDEATIQKCLDAIHNYNITWKHYNGKLVDIPTKDSIPEKPVPNPADDIIPLPIKEESAVEKKEEPKKIVSINPKDMMGRINKLTNNISKESKLDNSEEAPEQDNMAKSAIDPYYMKDMGKQSILSAKHIIENAGEDENNESAASSKNQPKVDNISYDKFIKDSISARMPRNKFAEALQAFITNHPDKLTSAEMSSALAFLNNASPYLGIHTNPMTGNPMPAMTPIMPHNPMAQSQQQIPKIINPMISGTCPCCQAPFTVPATITHRLYCFSCGTLMEY